MGYGVSVSFLLGKRDNMKKMTVFSFFRSNNIGDLLIADQVSEVFGRYYDCKYCDIGNFKDVDIIQWKDTISKELTSNIKKQSKFKKAILSIGLLNSAIGAYKAKISDGPAHAVENCKDSDIVVFAGGNSIMELGYFSATTERLYRVIKALKKNGKKVAFCFCGVGPFHNKASYRKLQQIISLVDFISVRDNASYDMVVKACPNVDIEIWRDPVMLKKIEYSGVFSDSIGVNVYFGHNKANQEKIRTAFVGLIKELREQYPNRRIILFSSELTDIEHVMAVKNAFQSDSMVEARRVNTIDGLFAIYNSVCCVLGTRMHTVITALISHKPVVSLSWASKVKSLMEYFNNEDKCFDINAFANDHSAISEALDSLIAKGDEAVKSNDKILSKARENIEDGIEKFKERL